MVSGVYRDDDDTPLFSTNGRLAGCVQERLQQHLKPRSDASDSISSASLTSEG